MFDLDQFIADCRASLVEDATHKSVREVVARAVSDPGAVLKGLGEPQRSGIQKIYHSGDLTILNVVWGPRMTISPHDHQMWAVIGIYTGREDNIFWRRLPGGKVEGGCASALREGCGASRTQHHSFSDQPDLTFDRRHSRLRRRFLCCRAKRMGS